MYFREEDHTYWVDETCSKRLISVTQLLKKHGLSPDYTGISEEVLEKKAEFGKLIHKEIEEWIKHREVGFTQELKSFIDYVTFTDTHIIASEKMVGNDLYAGTIDLVITDDKQPIIADIKTTSSIHKESVSWQLSLYLYLYIDSKDNWDNWKGQCYHFDKEANLKVVDVLLKPLREVEYLLECERDGKLYSNIQTLNVDLDQINSIERMIAYYDEQKKEAEKKAQELKEAILKSMEENGVTQFENENIKITYVAPSVRTSIDSARLKKDFPDIAKEYTKTSDVKASLRITLKGEKNE